MRNHGLERLHESILELVELPGSEWEAEKPALAEQIEKLEGREAVFRERLPKSDLQLYERLLQAREGVALAELEGKICQGCFMEVPSNLYVTVARGTKLAQCPSCDRIFYIRD